MTHSKSVNTGEKWKEKNAEMKANCMGRTSYGKGRKTERDLGKENKLENLRIDLAGEGEHTDF